MLYCYFCANFNSLHFKPNLKKQKTKTWSRSCWRHCCFFISKTELRLSQRRKRLGCLLFVIREVPLSTAEFLLSSSVGDIYDPSSSPSSGALSPGAGVATPTCRAAGHRVPLRPVGLGVQIWGSKSRQYLVTMCRQSFNWIWYVQSLWDLAPTPGTHLSPPVKALLTISELLWWMSALKHRITLHIVCFTPY